MKDSVAIHESKNSEKVVRFVNLYEFSPNFQDLYNNNMVWGVYQTDSGNLVATLHGGSEMEDILQPELARMYKEMIREAEVSGKDLYYIMRYQKAALENYDHELFTDAFKDEDEAREYLEGLDENAVQGFYLLCASTSGIVANDAGDVIFEQ